MAALGIEEKGAVVVTAGQGWHPGVVGLVAARLKERFGRPAFAIALEPGGIGTGSGRSITGVDLGSAVRHAVADGSADQGRRPRHGGRRHDRAGQARRRSAPIWRRRCTTRSKRRGTRTSLLIDGAVSAARRHRRAAQRHRARRAVRRRPCRAGVRAAVAHHRLCGGGRAGACARAAARGRRHDAQRHRVPRRRQAARQCADREPRPQRCTPPARSRIDRWNGEERVQFRLMDMASVEPVAR